MTGQDFVDFDSENMDAAIRFGASPWPDLDCRPLCDINLKLVCSPRYLGGKGLSLDASLTADNLKDHVIISLYDSLRDWSQLFPESDVSDKIICDTYFSAIKSAEEGLGIAVGLLPVINRLIESERLVTLDTKPLETDWAYWLVAPENPQNEGQMDVLFEWLKMLFSTL